MTPRLPPVRLLGLAIVAACEGPRSALDPAGRDADRVATLFWAMSAGAVVVWVVVLGIAIYATRFQADPRPKRDARRFILLGGAVFPTVVLTALLVGGLAQMPAMLALGPEDGVRVHVSGEQWWWRVRYALPDGGAVELANEIVLPVGERATFVLESPDVVHSFWIPPLGGKMDLIPGRVNVFALEPTEPGDFLGICAEFCGESHAWMAFTVAVRDRAGFERWLAHQATPAAPPTSPLTARGAERFLSTGCGACHTVRGTPATGRLGPDLTHVGGRRTIAGVLENNVDGFVRWLDATSEVKPAVHMPTFAMLDDADVLAIAAWLDALE